MTSFTLTYLDHNATTPVKPAVRDLMLEMLSFPGNASSVHQAGKTARLRLEEARAALARFTGAGQKDVIVFTSGATEANNLVLRGAGLERLVVSAIEHPSVTEALPRPAAREDIIPVTAEGIVDLAALDNMLRNSARSTLVSVMAVNNETGVIQPLAEIVKIARKHSALVHSDAAQAAGRIALNLSELGVDFLTLSAHKMGGPQGAGCLVIANCATVAPLLRGGNQEKNLRAGTENLAAIAGFGVAAELADVAAYGKLAALRDRLETSLKARAPKVKFFGDKAPRVANTSMFSLPGAASETQLIALDLAGICVSNGSACSSGTVKPSPVLKAMGASEAEIGAALRVSLGWNSTPEDVDRFLAAWGAMYDRIKARLSAA